MKWLTDPPYTLIGVLNTTITNTTKALDVRARACFILGESFDPRIFIYYLKLFVAHLVADDRDLEQVAFLSGSLKSITSLLHELIPDSTLPWLADEEPQARSSLLEVSICSHKFYRMIQIPMFLFYPNKAALTCAAALTLLIEDHRNEFLSPDRPYALPIVLHSLSHPEAGVRHAACLIARSLSRSIGVLRTAIGDSKLPDILLDVIGHDPDDRVTSIALKGIANMV